MFCDKIKIRVKAGNGGDGCVSFRREKYVQHGGPDGGDGGQGGDVVLVGDRNENNLNKFFFKHHWRAEDGGRGRGRQMTGKSGADCELKVPLGTQVFLLPERRLIADITEHGQRVALAKGGRGGAGNVHFKSAVNQAPRKFTQGEPGEEFEVELELKLLADVGIIGCPNAGKSTLLSKISNARPRIAAYPFTTLHPNVGTVVFDDFKQLLIADVPGLIKGAHRGVGLGHEFLRHIERCKLLLVLLDMAGVDHRQPWDDYAQLLKELQLYNLQILKKPRLVVANKMDLPSAARKLAAFRRHHPDVQLLPISALKGDGLPALMKRLRRYARAPFDAA
jgi:GTP-binding protein